MLGNKLITARYSIFRSILWILLLSIVLQTFLVVLTMVALISSGFERAYIDTLINSPVGAGGISLVSAIIVLTMLRRVTKQLNKADVWEFLGFKAVNKLTLLKILLLGVVYYCLVSFFYESFNVPTSEFMQDVKAQTSTLFSAIMLISASCIVAPFIEELIFRGVAYGRLKDSKIGVAGAVILPSVLFTSLHVQYGIASSFSIFLLSLLLGCIRYKTDNIWYCVALHFQFNVFSTIFLFTIR